MPGEGPIIEKRLKPLMLIWPLLTGVIGTFVGAIAVTFSVTKTVGPLLELPDKVKTVETRVGAVEDLQESFNGDLRFISCLLSGHINREPPEATMTRCGPVNDHRGR